MISGLDLTATVDYTLKSDTENPTIWTLGIMPSYLFSRIAEESVSNKTETMYKILQVSLKGWKNFVLPFSTEKDKMFGKELDIVPMSLLEQIPLNIVTELSVKVMDINKLSIDQRKN